MSNELKFPTGGRDGRDEELALLLRPLYEAPEADEYWNGLHARIMDRVGGAGAVSAPAEWWHELNRWSRMGAAAAALLGALAGAAWLQHRAAEARMAYEAVLAEPAVYSMDLGTEAGGARAPRGPGVP